MLSALRLDFSELRKLRADMIANKGAVLSSALVASIRILNFAYANPAWLKIPLIAAWYPVHLVYARLFLNCEFPIGTRIGEGLYIVHPYQILVHKNAVFGKHVTMFHAVNVGRAFKHDLVPIVEDGAGLGPRSSLYGAVRVRRGMYVPAHEMVTNNDTTYVDYGRIDLTRAWTEQRENRERVGL